ncbi:MULTISPECIES: HdeD family acid-resistance protein [unclassified Streptomyces]|uniref:HdeD family acid-resistance protein n=1 Tax=unclassified Streptomyces TaxID=2593676 RepID=UPI00109ED9B7|nr:HdeD family acid-resistance protein [Streptomyces sp. A1136]THA57021.1 HdeD family acid-resistance protein [Streptomyces sp. A1136]
MPRGADRSRTEPRREKRKLSRSFGVPAFLGSLLVVAGLVGLVYTNVATLTSVFLFGRLLLAGGVIGLAQAVQARKSNDFWLVVIVAAVDIAAGFVILRRPEARAEALTLFAALLFLTGGVFRLAGALVARGSNFGPTLVQGAFGILPGLLIPAGRPGNSLYVIGAFFSLALLFDGPSLLAMGLAARRILRQVKEDQVAPEQVEAGRGLPADRRDGADGSGRTAGNGRPVGQERSNN